MEDLVSFTKHLQSDIRDTQINGRIKYYQFLNKKEQAAFVGMLDNADDVAYKVEGGFEPSERARGVIFPEYIDEAKIDPKVSLFKVETLSGERLEHRQLLGSLMGLDIDRAVIGDVLVSAQGAYFASCTEFDAFFTENLGKVGRHYVKLSKIDEPVASQKAFEIFEVILSSMRLDVVVKALIENSRRRAEDLIEAGFVRLDHTLEKKVSRQVNVGSILSIRGHGRFEVVEVKSQTTKRGKLIAVVKKSV